MLTNRRQLLYLALLIGILVALRVQWPRIVDPYTIQDDFRKFHWMHRFEDPELFVDDPLTSPAEIHLGPVRLFVEKSRPGYSLLFFLTSPFIPPVLFNKLLIFPLLLLSVYFLFRIGEIARDPGTGFSLALTLIVLTTLWTSSTSVAAGLPRSFMTPILLGIVFFLMTDRYWIATGIAFIAAFFYLPATVLGLTTIALSIVKPSAGRWPYRIGWRRILPLVVFFVLLLLTFPMVGGRIQSIWASMIEHNGSLGTVLGNPNFLSGGRWPLFIDFPFLGHGALVNNVINLWLLVVLTVLSLTIYLQNPQTFKHFPRVLKVLFIASVLLYFLAWLAIFLTASLALYFPSRYTRSSLVLVLLLFVVMNLGSSIRIFWTKFLKLGRSSKILLVTVVFVAALTIFLLLEQNDYWSQLGATRTSFKIILIAVTIFLIGTIVMLSQSGRTLTEPGWSTGRFASRRGFSILFVMMLAALVLIGLPPDDHHFFPIEQPSKDLITFFQSTPKDSIAAGDPCSLDYIPLVAGRQILFSCEFYSRSGSDKVLDNFRAYYADSLSEVRDFCETYGVDYFVVEPGKFDISESAWIFFEPYNSVLNAEIISKAGYVLEDIPDSLRIYEDENFIVMECRSGTIGDLSIQATQVDGLGILAHDEISERLSQAGEVDMTIKWLADKQMLADYDVCFSIEHKPGKSRQRVCEPISTDLPTSEWQIPEIRYENYKFRFSPYLEGGDYTIVASVNSREGIEGSERIVIGEVSYSALPRTLSTSKNNPKSTYHVIWGDVIALASYDVTRSESNTLDLNVRWHALKRMAESYKSFAHLRVADTNEIVSQIDTIPQNWTYPTDWWEENEIVTDTLSIPLNDVKQGRLELWLGFYNPESGERLSLTDPISPTLPIWEEAVKIYEFEHSDLGWNH